MVNSVCEKCGELISRLSNQRYCPVCMVRLGFTPYSLGYKVWPGPADFYQKQVDEPILDTWITETERKRDEYRRPDRPNHGYPRFDGDTLEF